MRPTEDGELECVHENYSSVRAVPDDVPVIGYHNDTVNTLRLWRAEYSREDLSRELTLGARHRAYRYTTNVQLISRFLYPEDSTEDGRRLRLMQEYFMVSAGLQSIVRHYKRKYKESMFKFDQYIAIHINDTHPALVVPELMRILLDEEGMAWEDAGDITCRTVAYTNHTILPEAMEKWSIPMFQSLLPRIYLIVEEINNRWLKEVRRLYPGDENKARSVAILWDGQVHMAHLSVLGSHSVNGVAEIHSQILKDSTLHQFYTNFPNRITNKTNGVTHRRWLIEANPQLSDLIDEAIGDEWRLEPSKLIRLKTVSSDSAFLDKLAKVKKARKEILADYIKKEYDTNIAVDSIFDIQIKRLHEYKRQLLNAFSILYLYFGLKDGSIADITPVTFLFGAKSAPGYRRAKAIIKFINEVGKLIANDPDVNQLIKVVFVSNYNVSYAEKLVAAADVSEQISTAGTEASGTGNMKLMLNGAVTLGTYDGANVEIVEEAGEDCNYIFGAKVEELETILPQYDSRKIFSENPKIRRVVERLIDGTLSDGGSGDFRELYYALLDGASWHAPDHYYLLGDLESYVAAKLRCNQDYQNRMDFAAKQWKNICNAGKFSSDRTIAGYAKDIWQIDPVTL